MQRYDTGEISGRVHSIETFALVDGPGVRFAAFLAGCPMRCQYCHNPDTWHAGGECLTAEALWKRASRFRDYWKPCGGVTLSGGEPMLQMRFATAFFSLAQKQGVHTVLDTSGQPYCGTQEFQKQFTDLIEETDLVMLDIKAMDEKLHVRLTGSENRNIRQMAVRLSDMGKEMWIRHVLVPGVTDSEKELLALRRFIDTMRTVTRVEVLAYHTMGKDKWLKLGMRYPLEGTRVPTREEIEKAERLLGIK